MIMNAVFDSQNGVGVRGRASFENLTMVTVDTPVQTTTLSSTSTTADSIYTTYQEPTLDSNFTIVPSTPNCTYTSSAPTVATVDTNGVVTRVSDGIVTILVSNGIDTAIINRAISRKVGSTSVLFTDFVAGSVRRTISDNIKSYISSVAYNYSNASNYSNIIFDSNGNIVSASRNPSRPGPVSLFVASSLGQQVLGQEDPAHLISPRHALQATHWATPVGTILTWLDASNTVWKATIASKMDLGNDVTIYYLNWANNIAPSITPYKLLPANYTTYLPVDKGVSFIPACNLQGNTGTSLFRVVSPVVNQNKIISSYMNSNPTYDVQFSNWSSAIISGDSSGPMVLPITIAGTLVPTLLSAFHEATGGNNPSYADMLSDINAGMKTIAQNAGDSSYASYNCSIVDLSSFTAF